MKLINGQRSLRSNGLREGRSSTAAAPLQVQTSLSLRPGPHWPWFGPQLPFCLYTSMHARPGLRKRPAVSGCTAVSPILGDRSRCADAHVLSSSPARGQAPPDGHMHILGKYEAGCLWRASWQHVWECRAPKVWGQLNSLWWDAMGSWGRAETSVLFSECVCALIAQPR